MPAEDVRQRRAERVKQQKGKNFVADNWKGLAIGGILLLVVAVAVANPGGILPQGAKPLKFAHEHPTYFVFIENERVEWNHGDYDISKISDKVHLHIDGRPARAATWHVESRFPDGIPDLSLEKVFAQYGVHVRQGTLKLDTHDGHNGTEWKDTGAKKWRMFVSKMIVNSTTGANERQAFVEQTGDYSQYAPRDLDQILLTYGDLTPEMIAAQQAQATEPVP